MTYEIYVGIKGKNYVGGYSFKGYRKDLKRCITAAQNAIDRELADRKQKDITEFRVRIKSFNNTIYQWKYKPTIR